jgi:flagellar hook-basal body complex protein FliE
MSDLHINQVLAQIRALQGQASGGVTPGGPSTVRGLAGSLESATDVNESANVSFTSILRNGLDHVDSVQKQAKKTVTDFQRGVPGVELPQVMLDLQKSSITFRGAVEVRNKMVSAYQEIMNMPI